MNLTKKRWMVLIASCLINLCIGALYAWSVFASGMAEYLSSVNHSVITTSSLAIVFSVANTVGPITMIGGGKLVRSIGPRWVINWWCMFWLGYDPIWICPKCWYVSSWIWPLLRVGHGYDIWMYG